MFAGHSFVCHVFSQNEHTPDHNDNDVPASETLFSTSSSLESGNFLHALDADGSGTVTGPSDTAPGPSRTLPPTSGWHAAIWTILQQFGHVDVDDDGIIIFVNSYYLDHDRHRREDRSRPLRFDQNFHEWERDVRFIWEDVVDEQFPIEIDIVHPEPPFFPHRGTIATVIVHQRPQPFRTASLITAVIPADPVLRIQESAHSVEHGLDCQAAIHLSGAEDICRRRHEQGCGACTIHVGWRLLVNDAPIPMRHGLGITIRVHFPLEDLTEDVNSLMARRPTPRRPSSSSTTSYTTSSSSSRPDWRQTVVFLLDGRTVSSSLPWHNSEAMLERAALAVDLQLSQVLRVHHITHRPTDFIQMDLQGLLLQRSTEFRPTPFVRIVLLDMEIHVTNDVQPTPFQRRARWLPYFTTRKALFRVLGLAAVQLQHPELCHLWRNNVLIDDHDEVPLHLTDGDYVKVFVGDYEPHEMCASDEEEAVNVTSHSATNTSDEHPWEEWDDITMFQTQVKPQVCKSDPADLPILDHLVEDRGGVAREGRSTSSTTGLNHFIRNHLQRLHRIVEDANLIECEEEGRIAYVTTWYLHHADYLECRIPRYLRLDLQMDSWETEILDLWGDLVHEGEPFQIRLVRPQPPCEDLECTQAHLFLEQGHAPDHVPILISVMRRPSLRFGDLQISHSAHVVHKMQNTPSLIRHARPQNIPVDGFCRAYWRQLPFAMVDIEEVEDGACIELRISAELPQPLSDDEVSLMQTSAQTKSDVQQARLGPPAQGPDTSVLPSTTTPICAALDVPGDPSEQAHFNFNPDAAEFHPLHSLLRVQDEFIQDLHTEWQAHAWAWEEEEASCSAAVWFVDHRWTHPHGTQFRKVRLWANFLNWYYTLEAVWLDSRDPTSSLEFHLVQPRPPCADPEIKLHIILIQHPRDDWVTSLVSFKDVTTSPLLAIQMAITTHERILLDNILRVCQLYVPCTQSPITLFCEAWWGQLPLLLGAPIQGRSGYGITGQFRTTISAFQPTTDEHSALQTALGSTAMHRDRPRHHTSERLTTGLVAHDQWPLSDVHDFPKVGECKRHDWPSHAGTVVRVLHTVLYPESQLIPDYIELPPVYSELDAVAELQSWGISCRAFLCGEHDAVFVLCDGLPSQELDICLYCGTGEDLDTNLILRTLPTQQTELQHMKFLHHHGATRAVIKLIENWGTQVQCVHFEDVQPLHDTLLNVPRQRTPWPAPQARSASRGEPFALQDLPRQTPSCLLKFNMDELRQFMREGQDPELLWQDYGIFDLPDLIRTALDSCQQLDHFDRYVIYTDGSSQTSHRHRPPEWIALHDLSDSWAFAVFAEQYSLLPDQPSRLQFLGFQCHQVLYEEQAPHFIGTNKTGSDAAETEALFWAGLWRVSQNNDIPTVFVSDSRLIGDQAAGRAGSKLLDSPFRHLREVFQTLRAMLPGDGLRIDHTRSHAGDPFNELVDWLAKQEGKSSLYLRRQSVHMPSFGDILRHLWLFVQGPQGLPALTEHGLNIGDLSLPAVQGCSSTLSPLTTPSTWCTTTFTISCATANVRTFYKGQEGHPGKIAYVREQFQTHHLNFLGIQEARTDQSSSLTSGILRLASGHVCGQLGVELWANLRQPVAWQGHQPLFLVRQDFVVVSASPRHMLVHVYNQFVDLWLLVAHAPHSGADEQTREQWWLDLNGLISTYVQTGQLITMIDANATTGARDDVHVFEFDDIDSPGTSYLRDFMEQHMLYAPATSSCHRGDHGTWLNPATETSHRIDFVLLPMAWKPSCQWSEGLEALDFGHLGDHQATAVQLYWKGHTLESRKRSAKRTYDRQSITHEKLGPILETYCAPPWTTDIEEQVHHLNDFLQNALQCQCPRSPSGPKKSFITPAIWELRAQKLRLQRRQKDQRRVARRELLHKILVAWRDSADDLIQSQHYTYGLTLQLCHMKVGIALWKVTHQLRGMLTKAKRTAVQSAIEALPADGAASQILCTLKPLIGSTNSRTRKASPLPAVLDEQGQPCLTPEALQNRWIAFFGAMEGGERVSEDALRAHWIQQLCSFVQKDLLLASDDLPALTDLENAFRRVKPRKAVGEDDIPPELCHQCPTEMARLVYSQLIKLCAHGQEALLHKGGVLVAAWKKKGSQLLCESYRSLLISSHVAKTVHRAVRDHQADVYEAFLQAGQVGGRRAIPVTLGVHYIRATARTAKRDKLSHALIFLDLREAFYRILRPLAVGGSMTDALLAQVMARLNLPEDAVADLHQLLHQAPGTEMAGMKPHLRRALQALHTNTHFKVPGQTDRVHTQIGSRPGDPFADVVFGYVFARILSEVEAKLITMDVLEVIRDLPSTGLFPAPSGDPIPHHILGPTWMDDLCISITGTSALALEHRAGIAASVLLETCMAHGVTPNLDRGKTEVLFAFRGAGSKALRTKYFGQGSSTKFPVITEYGTHAVSIVGQYSHLGNIAHHSSFSKKEIRRRIGIGNSAFSTHRRLLFQNPAFTQQRRVELFLTLVYSKIAYGMDSWVFDTKQDTQYFHSAMLRLYRRLLKLPPDTPMSDDVLLAKVRLPAPEILLRISRLRYLGLLYRCEQTTPWALFRSDTTWCATIQQDLHWMWSFFSNTSKLKDPLQHFASWEYVLRYHRSYWKTLLQRCQLLHVRQHHDRVLVRELHRDVLTHFGNLGTFQTAPIRPRLDPAQQHDHFGCMCCQLRCRTKPGEGVHLFRAHGIVAQERLWMTGTACEACLKEFHTHDKLQVHLRTARRCRNTLNAKPTRTHYAPGFGSTVNTALRERHDGLIPVQTGSGPKECPRPPREPDLHHVDLFERLALDILDFEDTDLFRLLQIMKRSIQSFAISWTRTKLTLSFLAASFTEDFLANAPFSRAVLQDLLRDLGDVNTWPFLREVEFETATGEHLHALDLYEQWCEDLATIADPWSPSDSACPRPFYKERIILHAYSGRRRPGDLQWYIDHLAAQRRLEGIIVISLDLVIDAQWGDISRTETQSFWLDALRTGKVLGMLSGPPCCTWSIARGKTDASLQNSRRQGPRVIRTLHDLWGILSVSLREHLQLHDGHVLLGFSILAMAILSTTGGVGILEHPGEPADPEAASIWRLPLIKMLLNMPGFDLLHCAQGFARSRKRQKDGTPHFESACVTAPYPWSPSPS